MIEVFTGQPGIFISLKETISGFKRLLSGKYDYWCFRNTFLLNIVSAEGLVHALAVSGTDE